MTKQRRAVSEVIVSLLLLAITVVGGLLVFGLVSSNDSISGLEGNIEEAGKRGTAVKAIGFDTRNGCNLAGIAVLDNVINNCQDAPPDLDGLKLCTVSCSSNNEDKIVIKIRNTSIGTLTIHALFVNEIAHTFDTNNNGVTLAANNLPSAGEFSIISDSADVKFSSPQFLAGQDARLIIKLDSTVNGSANIELTEGIRIDIQASDFDPVRFIIPAGSVR